MVCQKYDLSMDDLVGKPLGDQPENSTKRISGSSLRILPIAMDQNEDIERATLVPVQAAAGYLNGYGDIEFIEKLPSFKLPFKEISNGKTYRIFQINGDSMLPIASETYVISSYVLDWNDIKNDELYVIVSKNEGIVFKRILNNLNQGFLRLKSDNPSFESYDLNVADTLEVWRAEGLTSFDFPEPDLQRSLAEELKEIKQSLNTLNQRIKIAK
ncbi:MAG: S24/S26 family peptidase [Salibacteraceae bacterium]